MALCPSVGRQALPYVQPRRRGYPIQSQAPMKGRTSPDRKSINCVRKNQWQLRHECYLFRPAHNGPWPKTRGEPGIKYILILLKGKLCSPCQLLGALHCFFQRSTYHPILTVGALQTQSKNQKTNTKQSVLALTYVLLFSFKANKVRRASMAPPELPRNTPVLDILEPTVPIAL